MERVSVEDHSIGQRQIKNSPLLIGATFSIRLPVENVSISENMEAIIDSVTSYAPIDRDSFVNIHKFTKNIQNVSHLKEKNTIVNRIILREKKSV